MLRRRLHIQNKLLVAFLLILVPVLGLLLASSLAELRRTRGSILESQFVTAQAVAVQVTEAFDSAIGIGWAVSQDHLVQTLDLRVLDSHLRELVELSPMYDSIGVYDANGNNCGSGHPEAPVEPRLNIADQSFFQQVMATNAPVISKVIELGRPLRAGLVISVPIRDREGQPIGVVNLVMRADQMAHRHLATRLQQHQTIFLIDPDGRLAFHTGSSYLPYRQSDAYMWFEPVQEALAGIPIRLERFTSPFTGDERMGALVPTPKYPWVVGVSIPNDDALAALHEWLHIKLMAFIGILLLSVFLALVLARFYSRPVQQLRAAAHALGQGAMDRRVHIQTGDELEELGAAFNNMAEQIARRTAEVDTLRLSAERQALQLQAIIASVPDAIFLASADCRLVGANPAGFRLLGLEDSTVLEKPLSEYLQCYDLRHEDGRLMKPEELPLVRALSGESFTDAEVCFRGLDGKQWLLSVNGAPVKDSSGRIILGVVVIRDVTQYRREEERMAQMLDRELALARIGQVLVHEVELERIAHIVVEQSLHTMRADAIGLWLVDAEHRELTLMASHQFTAEMRDHLHHVDFEAPALAARAARWDHPQVIEDLLVEGRLGDRIPHEKEAGFRGLAAIPLHSRERLVGVMAYYLRTPRQVCQGDLEFYTTVGQLFAVAIERARLFREVRDALRLREEFMTAAAHELKTPVTTIRAWSEILLDREALTPRQQKGLNAILRNSRRMTRLVEHLFATVRMSPGRPKLERRLFDLQALVREQVKVLARGSERELHLEAADPLVVDADRQLMREVVTHLLENALKYSPRGGTIEVRLWRQGGDALVAIHDEGPGIPPERQPHIFEPLYEPQPPGTPGYTGVVGLGLYLSRQIIEAHGGHIWLESAPGKGSTFFFSMPLAANRGLVARSVDSPGEEGTPSIPDIDSAELPG